MIRIYADFDKAINGLTNIIKYVDSNKGFVKLEAELTDLANYKLDQMRHILGSSRRRTPDRGLGVMTIENALGEPISIKNDPGRELIIGIGSVARLNAESPYWELINDGGTYVTKETHVVPTTYFSDPVADFVTFKAGSSHTIYPMGYIDDVARTIDRDLQLLVKDYVSQLVDGMRNAGI